MPSMIWLGPHFGDQVAQSFRRVKIIESKIQHLSDILRRAFFLIGTASSF